MSHPGGERGDADPFAAFLVGDGRNISVAASSPPMRTVRFTYLNLTTPPWYNMFACVLLFAYG